MRRFAALYVIAFSLGLCVLVGVGTYYLGAVLLFDSSMRVFGALLFGGSSVLFIYRPEAWMELRTMPRWNKKTEPEAPAAPAQVATIAPPKAPAMVAPSPEQMHYYSMGYQQGVKDGVQQGYQAAVQKVLGSLGIELVEKDEAPAEQEEGGSPSSAPAPEEAAPLVSVRSDFECARCHHSKELHEPLSAHSCFTKGCQCTGYTEKLTILQKILNR